MRTLIIVIIVVVVLLVIIALIMLPRMRAKSAERREIQARDHRQEAQKLAAQAESATELRALHVLKRFFLVVG